MEEMDNKTEENDTIARIYEVGYLLVPTISGENVPAIYSKIKDLIASLSGKIISDEMPRQIELAYPMVKVVSNIRNKFDTAYFGWVKFEMGSQEVLDLKKKMDLDINVIRFLILKTVKENTIATKKFVRTDAPRKKNSTKKDETEEGAEMPINKEEIDKEIDAMVAV